MIPALPHVDETQACNLISNDAGTAQHYRILLPLLKTCNVLTIALVSRVLVVSLIHTYQSLNVGQKTGRT